MDHAKRKQDHLYICLSADVRSGLSTGLEAIRLRHNALPNLNLRDVSTTTCFLGHSLAMPLLLSSMTGGTPEGGRINRRLAQAAQASGVALALGSGRIALLDPDTLPTFRVRDVAPDVLLLANLGAVQLNRGLTAQDCQRLVELVEADGLILHLNALQEALQPGGDTDFHGLLDRIAEVCAAVPFPVIVKEVGWGLSGSVAAALASAGVTALDVAGAGGTSWSEVERLRATDPFTAEVAAPFRSWGLTTVESLCAVVAACPTLPVIASGGLRSGVDLAKCLALGASLGGIGAGLLPAAAESAEAVERALAVIQAQLTAAMFATGAATVRALDTQTILRGGDA